MSFSHKCLPLFFLLALSGCEDNQFSDLFWPDIEEEVCDEDTTSVDFKQVAYWSPSNNDSLNEVDLDEIDFEALTHIIYTSVSVGSDGELNALDDDDQELLEEMVSLAHDADIEVMVALGTGSDSNFNSIAESSSLTSDFVDSVSEFIDDYDLDGVELNWQTIGDDDESENLEELLDELQEELGSKTLAMALPSDELDAADNIENDMFTYIDFANVHAFDSTDSDDLHSSLEDAEDAISYWTGRCLIQNKLVLGVPLYSVDDDEDESESFSYAEIVDDNSDFACDDENEGYNYNGIPTIIDKTNYALLYAGGMMMNSLEQDSFDDTDYLLLDVINETVDGNLVDICEQ